MLIGQGVRGRRGALVWDWPGHHNPATFGGLFSCDPRSEMMHSLYDSSDVLLPSASVDDEHDGDASVRPADGSSALDNLLDDELLESLGEPGVTWVVDDLVLSRRGSDLVVGRSRQVRRWREEQVRARRNQRRVRRRVRQVRELSEGKASRKGRGVTQQKWRQSREKLL